jgi:hypothetical protein
MVFDVNVALTWILFLALFPITFFWLRRAWRIGVRRDYSEVALRRGVSPPDPRKFAFFELALNLLAGLALVVAIVLVLLGLAEYGTWTAIAGSTIWTKFLLGFALSRHAHAKVRRSAP